MLRDIARANGLSVGRLIDHVQVPLYRNAYALLVSTAATSAFGLVYWMLAARYYPPETVGLNAAVISMLTFLAGVAQLPSMNAVLRYLPIAGFRSRRLVTWCYLFSIAFATAIGCLFLLTVDVWSPALHFLRQDVWLALWFLLGVVFWCIFALQDNVLTGLREAIYVPIENIPYAVVKIGLLILLAASFTHYGILASWTFPLIVILLPLNYLIFARLIPRHTLATADQSFPFRFSEIASFVAGHCLGALFMLAATRLLPVLVTNVASASANAYFYLPWTIASSLKFIITSMSTSFTVEVVADRSKLRAYSYRFLVHTTGVLLLPIAVLLISARTILAISGENYAVEGALLLRLLTLAVFPNIITALYLGIARAQQKVFGIIVLQLVLCVLTLGLSYVFLLTGGTTGVGIAILISETVVALGVLATSLRPILLASIPFDRFIHPGRWLRTGRKRA